MPYLCQTFPQFYARNVSRDIPVGGPKLGQSCQQLLPLLLPILPLLMCHLLRPPVLLQPLLPTLWQIISPFQLRRHPFASHSANSSVLNISYVWALAFSATAAFFTKRFSCTARSLAACATFMLASRGCTSAAVARPGPRGKCPGPIVQCRAVSRRGGGARFRYRLVERARS
ncbi:hypothetical protein BDZ45DRAFT_63144 [Acephala macrosclerotiorum]|nr:hypothetical protein BDZ45DRAFT_63144 [Acephala macrosclerotiorum]